MILRKPYGFLIKHFRMIHLILFGLSLYLSIKVNQIFNYYNAFAKGNASKLDAISYITNYYVIAIIFSIIICLIIYALMRYKKKPRILYLLLILLYLIIGVMVQVSYEGLHTIYITVLETKTLRLYRDLLRILVWVQYFSLIFLIIRGLGFDIKKFNFVRDLEELGENVDDSEEVELTLGGMEVTQRKFHRGIRELKYYYLENKTFIHLITLVLLFFIFSTFMVNKEVINKVYQEGEGFSSDNFNFLVTDSYITSRDYRGSLVGDLEHSFIVVRVSLAPRNGEREFESANMILKTKSNSYSPVTRYSNYFKDLGTVYEEQNISNEKAYLFLYSVLNSELNDSMSLVYAGSKVVKLSPVKLDDYDSTKELKVGEVLDLSDTVLKNGSISITGYELQDKFSYSYEYELRGEKFKGEYTIQSNQNIILNLKIKKEQLDNFKMYDFLLNYATLYYKADDQEHTLSFYDKTPGDYRDGVYLAVNKELQNASRIWFDITIRNKKYLYVLK